MPCALLKIECIGMVHHSGLERRMLSLLGPMPNRYWVAEIINKSSRFGYERRFLKGNVDYTHSNSQGTRGVYAYYMLSDGHIYEVTSPISWKRVDRYFCRVAEGRVERMTKAEVDECLNTASV